MLAASADKSPRIVPFSVLLSVAKRMSCGRVTISCSPVLLMPTFPPIVSRNSASWRSRAAPPRAPSPAPSTAPTTAPRRRSALESAVAIPISAPSPAPMAAPCWVFRFGLLGSVISSQAPSARTDVAAKANANLDRVIIVFHLLVREARSQGHHIADVAMISNSG